jgi:hypothetical protein
MTLRDRITLFRQNPVVKLVQFAIGCVLMALAPLVGPLPGPGGIIIFVLGLGLALRSSIWAKRRYIALKKKQPRLGGWVDWGLRRASAKSRDARNRMRNGETG